MVRGLLPERKRQYEQREKGVKMKTDEGKKEESCRLFMDENALPECV